MKTEHFGLVLSPEEKESLARLAEAEGLSAAAVMRRLLRRAAKELTADVSTVTRQPANERGQDAPATA